MCDISNMVGMAAAADAYKLFMRPKDREEASSPRPTPRSAQVPGKLCATGKKNSFHVAGRVLISPVLTMKSAKTMVAFGVVE
jgi:hypothetical protein